MAISTDFKRYFIFILSIFLICGCSKGGSAFQEAPDFSLLDIHGNRVNLKDLRGKIVLLDFWATWCPPCRMSIPELMDIQRRYMDKEVVVLGVSMDDYGDMTEKFLLAFKYRYGLNYTILRPNRELLLNYFGTQNMALPTLFIIDRKGKIRKRLVGYIPGAVEKAIKELR